MVSYRSYEDLPRINFPKGQEAYVSDSTIRDGAQMPGIVMKKQQKLKIYDFLHEIGVEKIEVFLYNERDHTAAREMFDRGYEKPEVTGWARASPSDIDHVLEFDEIDETGILMSVSDSHVYEKIGLNTRDEAREKYLDALQYAVDHGLRTRAHIEDMTRSDIEGFTLPLIKDIVEIDPECTIRICDTLGMGIPFKGAGHPYGIPELVESTLDQGAKNIELHVHDDYGQAVPNTIAGYWNGANWANLTFMGIGERAGNAELEKILLLLVNRFGYDKYNLKPLVDFAHYMEKEIGIRVPRNKAIIGRNVFAHESGIHTAGIIKNPFIYEPYPPELVGGKRQLLIGDSSGTDIIRHKVEETLREIMDIDIRINKNDHRIKAIHKDIQKLYDKEKRRSCISDEELRAYVEKYFMFESIVDKDIPTKDVNDENNKEEDSSD